ncbi:MAG: RNA polymerase factor sigma-54 [Candidatus Krumholzibacteria bacterium]|jgi:RNA polymerase sigma-54 factor|nr:RNA polymerase factor sigma-54 [Candidatus Krumholzibacteria bacterium]
MEMKMGMRLGMQQRLVMTPRLQQALKLLQMPTLELQQVLKQEILQNPLLEEVDDVLDTADEEKEEKEEEEPKEPANKDDQDEWDEFYDSAWSSGGNPEVEEREDFVERVPVARQTFAEYLFSQLRLATEDDKVLELGDYIIGSLDDSGYLTCPLEDIARTFGAELGEAEKVLKLIQTFDPPGVGARDLRECLLIQLEAKGLGDSMAAGIVRDDFDDFKQRKYLDLTRKLKISLKEMQVQAGIIGSLNPKPGLDVIAESPKYVIPDLVVERVGEKYVIYLNDRNVPRLRISQSYKDELQSNPDISEETKDFIQGRLKNAKWLIQTIEQRRRTMIKVMESIVEEQAEFFEKGTASLKPLTLQQVASKINMHESTVSRVTTNKYVQTPRGVYELKFFFSSALGTQSGEEVSAKSAKLNIKNIIEKEDPKRPLSDQKIADILEKDGLIIARRTVAKYREQLGILPARHRKQY